MTKKGEWFGTIRWTQMTSLAMLDQFRAERSLFDDAYFAALLKRRDEKVTAYWRLSKVNGVIFIGLMLASFGGETQFSQFGFTFRLDLFKEMLLFYSATLTFLSTLMFNDMNTMKGMLKARSLQQVRDFKPELDWEIKAAGAKALDMAHLDGIGEYTDLLPATPNHMMTQLDRLRTLMVGLASLLLLVLIIGVAIMMQFYVLIDVWQNPAMHIVINRVVCISSALSTMIYLIVVFFPRRIAVMVKE